MNVLSFRTDERFRSCPKGFLVTGKTNDPDLDKLNRTLLRQNKTGHWIVKQGRVSPGDAIFVLLPSQLSKDGYPRKLYGGVITAIQPSPPDRTVFLVDTFHSLPQISEGITEFLCGKVPPQGNKALAIWDDPVPEARSESFEDAVERSKASTSASRLARIASAPTTPTKVYVMVEAFVRNPDVVAEVLARAAGTCGQCEQPAPFRRTSNGEPFLEVHHKLRLADGGEDTVKNAVALCPNCHRKAHYGAT